MNRKFSNGLINESSPYLLQHAHNPVNWYAWGEEALAMAKEKDLPVLVSVGYSACHWCHVMERESFENEAVAQYMNSHFVNIKIDREERPDLDHLYMDALQAMTGSGGWPLNVFLTTDGKPFYGGTYFPPVKAFNRASWTDTLHSITNIWETKRDEVEKQADILIEHIKKSNGLSGIVNIIPHQTSHSFYSFDVCKEIAEGLLKNADETDGGFGKAPKFLQTYSLQYLLAYSHFFKHGASEKHAVLTLQKMINGGIYDQLAGGISRYSTDNEWLAPHFEKMLYDNALLINVLCDTYQLTKLEEFKTAIENTLSFILREMKDRFGGYYTALDADSEGIEGQFYVWQKKEIEDLLGNDAALFCDYYDITNSGNWEGKNILNVKTPSETIAAKYQVGMAAFNQIITKSKTALLQARNNRIRPGTDDKILLNSNALLLTAFCKAYAALGNENYKKAAFELYDFIEDKFADVSTQGCLFHTYKNNNAKYPAFLDDYAYLIQACIHLQEISSDQKYLLKAKQLMQYVIENFSDDSSGFMFYTSKHQKDVLVRKIELYDGATPSANGVMAQNMFYLGIILDEPEWISKSQSMMQSVLNGFTKFPSSFAVWAGIYLIQTAAIVEIVITGKDIQTVLQGLIKEYLPNKILQSSTKEQKFPLLIDKEYGSEVKLYLCRNYTCEKPVSKVSQLLESIIQKSSKYNSHNI